jgi:hypothetical protein
MGATAVGARLQARANSREEKSKEGWPEAIRTNPLDVQVLVLRG